MEKKWEKLRKIPAWQLTKVRNQKEVIDEAEKKGRKVYFASLMYLCDLKNSELEPQFQNYKGRVAFRGDIVKDDSGSYAVFIVQGSSASQMTAAKVMDFISRLPGMTSSRRSISFYPGQNGRCTGNKVRMPRHVGTSTNAQMAKIVVQYGRPNRSS